MPYRLKRNGLKNNKVVSKTIRLTASGNSFEPAVLPISWIISSASFSIDYQQEIYADQVSNYDLLRNLQPLQQDYTPEYGYSEAAYSEEIGLYNPPINSDIPLEFYAGEAAYNSDHLFPIDYVHSVAHDSLIGIESSLSLTSDHEVSIDSYQEVNSVAAVVFGTESIIEFVYVTSIDYSERYFNDQLSAVEFNAGINADYLTGIDFTQPVTIDYNVLIGIDSAILHDAQLSIGFLSKVNEDTVVAIEFSGAEVIVSDHGIAFDFILSTSADSDLPFSSNSLINVDALVAPENKLQITSDSLLPLDVSSVPSTDYYAEYAYSEAAYSELLGQPSGINSDSSFFSDWLNKVVAEAQVSFEHESSLHSNETIETEFNQSASSVNALAIEWLGPVLVESDHLFMFEFSGEFISDLPGLSFSWTQQVYANVSMPFDWKFAPVAFVNGNGNIFKVDPREMVFKPNDREIIFKIDPRETIFKANARGNFIEEN